MKKIKYEKNTESAIEWGHHYSLYLLMDCQGLGTLITLIWKMNM